MHSLKPPSLLLGLLVPTITLAGWIKDNAAHLIKPPRIMGYPDTDITPNSSLAIVFSACFVCPLNAPKPCNSEYDSRWAHVVGNGSDDGLPINFVDVIPVAPKDQNDVRTDPSKLLHYLQHYAAAWNAHETYYLGYPITVDCSDNGNDWKRYKINEKIEFEMHLGNYCTELRNKRGTGWLFDNLWINHQGQFKNVPTDCFNLKHQEGGLEYWKGAACIFDGTIDGDEPDTP